MIEPIEDFTFTQEGHAQALYSLRLAAEYGRKSTEELKEILFTGGV